jgi:hypothetical protein
VALLRVRGKDGKRGKCGPNNTGLQFSHGEMVHGGGTKDSYRC